MQAGSGLSVNVENTMALSNGSLVNRKGVKMIIEVLNCIFCKTLIKDEESNNAAPVKDGRCCHACNWDVVVPARIEQLNNSKG
jgi:hypothetical protein